MEKYFVGIYSLTLMSASCPMLLLRIPRLTRIEDNKCSLPFMIFYIIYRRCKWYLLQMYAVFHSQAKIVEIYLIK